MSADDIQIGAHVHEIDTPSLLLDLNAAQSNLRYMLGFLSDKSVKLRPHVKLFRGTPELARLQLDAGAIGMTCAKVSEAEVLVEAGIKDILIANQVVGSKKIRRLVELARRSNIKVAVDSRDNAQALSEAALSHGVTIGVLVEVNIGHNRCGVAPYEPALELTRFVLSRPSLQFSGLTGYDGHCTLKIDESEREALSIEANTRLVDTGKYIEDAGIRVDIVSGSGTFTYRYASQVAGLTEIQAGSYLLMDTTFQEHGVREFVCALTVLATVISQPSYPGANGMIILDVGRKSISPAYGTPEVKDIDGARVLSLSDEHARVILENDTKMLRVGDKIELWVRDANATINQFDCFYVIRDGIVEAIWQSPLCGDHT
jgi:D-serine deaminase-like pyridoxal phosphate-dependent protein